MKKILIFGGDSQLAQCFHKLYPEQTILLKKREADITCIEDIRNAIEKYPCQYICNFAAITDMEACEKDPHHAFLINTIGVYLLNKICNENKIKFIHISSNYAVNPINVYGWSKYLSEMLLSNNSLIIRTSFYSKNYYIIKHLLNNITVNAYDNLLFNPVSINRLAKEIFKNKDKRRLLNIFSSKKLTNFEFALKICHYFEIDKKLVKKNKYIDTASLVKRPTNTFTQSDIEINIDNDIEEFKIYVEN